MITSVKIAAIKAIRENRHVGLIEVKNAIEAYDASHPHATFAELVLAVEAEFPPHAPTLKECAAAFLNVATFPAWAGDDCRLCAYDYQTGHAPDCEYAIAEKALRAAIDRTVDKQ